MTRKVGDWKAEQLFAMTGFCSTVLTLTIGMFSVTGLVLGSGIIFASALFASDSLLQGPGLGDSRSSIQQRLGACVLVMLCFPCAVVIFVATGTFLDDYLNIDYRNLSALLVAGTFASLAFFAVLKFRKAASRKVLLQLLAIAFASACLAGTSPFWGKKLLLNRPYFISPFWVSLLLVGETGFAWMWGRSFRPEVLADEPLSRASGFR